MQMYELLRETDALELVKVIKANNLEEAKEKAKNQGYGKGYRIEEMWEGD